MAIPMSPAWGRPQGADPVTVATDVAEAGHVHRTSFLVPFVPDRSIFVTEYSSTEALSRQPARAVIFLTAIEYRGSFWEVPLEGRNALRMAARRGFFAYSLDWIGLGESYRPPDGRQVDFRANAEPVAKLVDYVRRTREVARVDLIGEGYGGEVASVLAADSERIRSVVLTNVYYRELGPIKDFFPPQFKQFLEGAPAGYWVPNAMEKTLFSVQDPEIRDYVFATQKDLEVPVGPFLAVYGPGPLTGTAKAARVPALIVNPELSDVAAAGDLERLAAEWAGGARLVTLKGSHHVSRLESPEIAEEYYRQLFGFLEEDVRSSRPRPRSNKIRRQP